MNGRHIGQDLCVLLLCGVQDTACCGGDLSMSLSCCVEDIVCLEVSSLANVEVLL